MDKYYIFPAMRGPSDEAPENFISKGPACSGQVIGFVEPKDPSLQDNDAGSPGRGPYRIISNTKEFSQLYNKSGTLISINKCEPELLIIEPKSWSPTVDRPKYDNQGLLFKKIKSRKGHEYKDAMMICPPPEKLGLLVPNRSVFLCSVFKKDKGTFLAAQNTYTINVLKRVISSSEFYLRFGTSTINRIPFNAYSEGSTLMTLRIDARNKTCEIKYIQKNPTFELFSFFDKNGRIIKDITDITGNKEHNNLWHGVRLIDQKDSISDNNEGGCITGELQQTDAIKEAKIQDWRTNSWCELARQFSLYFNCIDTLVLSDAAQGAWGQSEPKSDSFSIIYLSHLSIGQKKIGFYQSCFKDLKINSFHQEFKTKRDNTVNISEELYNAFLNFLDTKKFSHIDANTQNILTQIIGPLDQETKLVDGPGSKGLVSQLYESTRNNKEKIKELFDLVKDEYADNVFEDIYISEDEKIKNTRVLTYFLWNKVIKGLKSQSEINRLQDVLKANGFDNTKTKKTLLKQSTKILQDFNSYNSQWSTNNLDSAKASKIQWRDWAPCFI